MSWKCGFLIVITAFHTALGFALRDDFYKLTCPSAEDTVEKIVTKALVSDPGLGASLIRMHFHDCFVRGCDGSILLDSLPGQEAEKEHPANNPSLRGFQLVDEVKTLLESACPGQVSCADILALVARDSVHFLGGITYSIPVGRRDGNVSLSTEVKPNLPSPTSNAQELKESFARKGLSLEEMVTLSGAHSIGVSHCSSFTKRLYFFNATHPEDPSIDKGFLAQLKRKCPNRSSDDPLVPLEAVTPKFLDNIYYSNLKKRKGLLSSDQTLFESPLTASLVEENANLGSTWGFRFGEAMKKMGSIEVLTGQRGEIRKNCRLVN